LHEALADPATRDEALEITRGLIERVLVKPGEPRGSFEVELEGRSRRWSNWGKAQNAKKPPQMGRLFRMRFVVR
jgi:hypothetical protein